MTDKVRKERANFTADQKLQYAKLMTEEGYTSKQIMEISGAGLTAVSRCKKQHLSEQSGETNKTKTALDPQLRRIQQLELQLKEAKEDNDILKKVNSSMNIQRVFSLFNAPLSSYYKALEEHVSNPNTDRIITIMQALHAEHIHCLGRRRMHKELIKEGFTIGTFKVAGLMKDAGIIAKIPKKPSLLSSLQ